MMTKFLKKFTVSFLTTIAVFSTIEIAPTAADDSDGKPDIYEISDEDSSIFIMGTVHILPAGIDWQKDDLAERIALADSVYLELDQDDPDFATKMQGLMGKYAPNTTGKKLTQALTPAELAGLMKMLAPTGMPEAALDQFSPWLIMMQAGIGNLVANGYNPQLGVENIILELAKNSGHDIQGLETVGEQISIFAKASFEEQIIMLKSTIKQGENPRKLIDQMVVDWQADNLDSLAQTMNAGTKDIPEIGKRLIEDRNRNWVIKLKEMLASNEEAFIAVGAGHLPGEAGILPLMEAAGFKITRH